jgi:hypothetical protein
MSKNWFDHDYSARNDEKVLEIRARHGQGGYGLYFMFVECLAENHGYIPMSRIGGISIGLGVTKEFMCSFIEECIECELLALNEQNNVYSPRLLKHVDKVKSLSEAGKKGVEKREENRKLKQIEAVVKPPLSHPSTDKIRLEENKEENTNTVAKATRKKKEVDTEFEEKLEKLCAYYPLRDGNKFQPSDKVQIRQMFKALNNKPSLMTEWLADYERRNGRAHSNLEKMKTPLTFLYFQFCTYKDSIDSGFYVNPYRFNHEQMYLNFFTPKNND